MLLNLIKKLKERTINIIGTILEILIIVTIASLVMCLVIGAIGKFANLPFMTSLAGYCLLLFLITAGLLITVGCILLIFFFIDIIKRDGLKKLLRKQIKTLTLSFIILLVINFIRYKNLEWIKSFLDSLLITFSLFFTTQAVIFIKEVEQENSLNNTDCDSNSKKLD